MIKVKIAAADPPIVISVDGQDLYMYKDGKWFFCEVKLWYSVNAPQLIKLLNDIKDNSSKYQE